jgi:Polyketide cyclase / dehydrase and lipid transport
MRAWLIAEGVSPGNRQTPAAIYELLEDVPGWPGWAPLVGHACFVREGSPRVGGAGAIRRVGGLGVVNVDEEIVEARPPHYQRYRINRGLPVSDHTGEVHIEPLGPGSAVLWTGRFTVKAPGFGPVLRFLLARAIGLLATAAVRRADQPLAAAGKLR